MSAVPSKRPAPTVEDEVIKQPFEATSKPLDPLTKGDSESSTANLIPAPQQKNIEPSEAPLPPENSHGSSTQACDPSQKSLDDDEDRILSGEEELSIMKAVAGCDPTQSNNFQSILEQSLPIPVRFKTLQLWFHPDKQKYGKENLSDSERASKYLNSWREILGGNKNCNFWIGKGLPIHVEQGLSSYHEEAHQQATAYLKIIFNAMLAAPDAPSLQLKENNKDYRHATNKIQLLNAKMKKENANGNIEVDTGKIRLEELTGQWRCILKKVQDSGIRAEALCRSFHYPEEWAKPLEWLKSAQPGRSSTIATPQPTQGPNSLQSHPLPQSNSLQLWNATGNQIRTITLSQRMVSRCFRPGFTSNGEEIMAIQRLGFNGARLVTRNTQGMVRLISSGAAGGLPVLKGATDAGVPSFLQGEEEIRELRRRVSSCQGVSGLSFVALGEWKPSKMNLPFIAVGFYHYGKGLDNIEVAMSRSTLKRILSAAEGERLIAQYMTMQQSTSTIKEALEVMFPGETQKALLSSPNPQQEIEQQIQQLQTQLLQLQLQPQAQPLQLQLQPQAEPAAQSEPLHQPQSHLQPMVQYPQLPQHPQPAAPPEPLHQSQSQLQPVAQHPQLHVPQQLQYQQPQQLFTTQPQVQSPGAQYELPQQFQSNFHTQPQAQPPGVQYPQGLSQQFRSSFQSQPQVQSPGAQYELPQQFQSNFHTQLQAQPPGVQYPQGLSQ
ncbi:hypothetical protein N7466_007306 [Penicillium verhagenii]|uniref:uncharacterized protein n=1 Tax=Penicillium verhagenii TaxID=1562060 RepID=UPI0025451604|nr:uncharacterized protein N7466_007306 [Penicillium verhagenii]KAJ5928350.1 hypothetical protein N7466_007306 [Penicillium verhagenii]